MAGGGFSAGPDGREFEAKITPIVIISCIMAATGGLMFGYDVGVSGGVTSMPPFLKKFFPVVYRRTLEQGIKSNYCKYDNQGLQLFTSSLYLAGLTATFAASYTTRKFGRRPSMLIAGIFFIVGTILNAAAQDLAMLIIGRISLGCGVGFANQRRLWLDGVKAPNMFERAKEEFEAIVEAIHPKKESPTHGKKDESKKEPKKQEKAVSLSENHVKIASWIGKAKEKIETMMHHEKSLKNHDKETHEKSPKHHTKETHGRSNDIDESIPIDHVKGPNVFERAKEEIEAIVEAIHPKKEEKNPVSTPKKEGGFGVSIGRGLEKVCSPHGNKD